MLDKQLSESDWIDVFPELKSVDPRTLNMFTNFAYERHIPTGSMIYRENQTCDKYLLIVDGLLRVYKVSEDGNEFVLGRVKGGNACGLTTSSLLLNKGCLANCIAESNTQAIFIPKTRFIEAMVLSESFRNYVFQSLHNGMSKLVNMVGNVIFAQLDHRLAQLLIELADTDHIVNATHDHLATELGTAREVVSRLLKEFERNGWVKLFRGRILIINSQGLKALGAWMSN